MFTKYNLPFLLFIFMINLTYSQTISNDYYGVKAGQGKGIKFWNNHNYKIHMGNTDEYKYGPVNSYSIKMNMTGNLGRGWTWGTHLNTPVTALDNRGNLQTKGWLRSDKRILLFGSKQKLYGDNSSKLYWTSNHSTATQIVLRDVDNKQYGKLLGAADGNLFGLTDGDGHWSYKAFKDNYTSFHINNSEKMRISANGHVDISPNDYNSRLTVGGIGVFGLTYIGGSLDGTYFPDAVSGAYNLHLNAIKTNNIGGDIIFQSEGATKMTMSHAGKLIIGDVNGIIGDYKLYVEKGVLAEKVRVAVKNTTDWADYVFEEDYELLPLHKLNTFIQENKHLPGVPTATEVVENGLDMAKTDAILLKKLEEAYLYIIELKEDLDQIKKDLKTQTN